MDREALRNEQRSIGRMPIGINAGGHRFHIYWVRLIAGTTESLLTTLAKHSVYEIEYAVQRPLTIQIGSSVQTISEQQFLIVPPDMPHEIIDSCADGLKFILGFSPESGEFNQKCALSVDDTPLLRALVNVLGAFPASGSPEMLQSLLTSIMLAVLETLGTDESAAPLSESERCVQQFIRYAEASNGVGVTVREGARLANICERQLFRLCMSAVNTSPSEIIQRCKLDYIRRCISDPALSMTEIADLAGFQSEYAMTKFFRRHTGMTPSAFRRTDIF